MEEIIEDIQQTFGLNAYYLYQQYIFREVAGDDHTSYILNLEFAPASQGYYPDGTASIDVDLHTGELKRIKIGRAHV